MKSAIKWKLSSDHEAKWNFFKTPSGSLSGYSKKTKKNKNKTPDHFLFAFLSGRKGLLSVFPVNSQSASNIPIAF